MQVLSGLIGNDNGCYVKAMTHFHIFYRAPSGGAVQLNLIYVFFNFILWVCSIPLTRHQLQEEGGDGVWDKMWIVKLSHRIDLRVEKLFLIKKFSSSFNRYWNASSISCFPASLARQWTWRHRSIQRRCQLCSQRHLSAINDTEQTGSQIQTNTSERYRAPEH